MNPEKRETMSDKVLWTHARCCTCEDCIPWVTVKINERIPTMNDYHKCREVTMSDKFEWDKWDETEDPGPKSVIQKAYNQGRVDEKTRIVEKIKDNLTPSVAETVIAIIYAA